MASSGCAQFGEARYTATPIALPAVPADLEACALRATAKLPAARRDLTKAETEALIGTIRASELGHTDCGRRWLAFYEDVLKGYNTAPAR